jgi:hypothetical protein
MPAPAIVLDLVERFHQHLTAYKQNSYNEEQLRIEFLNPMFAALGWDMDNTQGYAAAYKEVIHEDALRVSGVTKAPDYAFRIGGVRKFFLEAKKPSVNIKDDIHPAYQLRRYAWSAKLPLSILCDFEEFAVYDCRIKPDKGDPASTARVMYLRYTDYATRWDEIAGIFAKDAILKGSFDQYADSHRAKRGTTEVDAAFLEEIERWRELLARNLALRNPGLSPRELNFAVQQTIDRIIFLRICEDRGIEPYGELMGLQNGTQVYPRLVQKFLEADRRYNSGLFHFSEEKEQSGAPDLLTPALTLDDKVLKDIFKHLYYPDSPYEFSVLPGGILGQVYERFLGKVVRITPGRQVKIEEKPEVIKAGGVVYTPAFIAETIVRQVLGRLLAGKTATTAAKLRLLDMACGSGIFLITLYQHLLDWHLAQYTADNAEKWARGRSPRLYRTQLGEWRLTLEERKRILLDHVYGVDIDAQAVEVTKLSLLLKLLEGEDRQTLDPQLALLPQRILPDLSQNIRCGNALIGPEFYDGQMALLDEEEAYRVNVFDWRAAFPAVFAAGGFDGIVGNPPYGADFSAKEIAYLQRYLSYQTYQMDSYLAFVENALLLLREFGYLGYIIPNTWLLNFTNQKLRNYLFRATTIERVVHHGRKIFPKMTVDTEIVILQNSPPESGHQITVELSGRNDEVTSWMIDQFEWASQSSTPINVLSRPESAPIIAKMKVLDPMDNVVSITQGTKPFQVGKGKPPQTRAVVDTKPYVADTQVDPTFRPLLRGSLINRYANNWNTNYYISFGDWLAEPRYSAGYDAPEKIVVRQTGDSLIATLDTRQFVVRDNLYSIVPKQYDLKMTYVLGILNSRLLNWYYQNAINPEKGEALAQVKRGHLAQLPIRTIDFADPADAARHARMVALVEQMLALHQRRAAARTPHEQSVLAAQIAATDRQIDRVVYELYGLSEEEVRIVEGG